MSHPPVMRCERYAYWFLIVCLALWLVPVAAADLIKGDFNQDGGFNQDDLAAFAQAYYDGDQYRQEAGLSSDDLLTLGDFNGDGVFDRLDARAFRVALINQAIDQVPAAADFNEDGQVDSTDNQAFRRAKIDARRSTAIAYQQEMSSVRSSVKLARQTRRNSKSDKTDPPQDDGPDAPTDDSSETNNTDDTTADDPTPPDTQTESDDTTSTTSDPVEFQPGYDGQKIGELDESGWTVLAPSGDGLTVYVSNSQGDDENSGLSPETPVQSLGKGYDLMRDGFPDRLLLKRGDVWTQPFDSWWMKSGRGIDEPMIIASYGSGSRPQIRPGTRNMTLGFTTKNHAVGIHHLAVVGLDFYADQRDPQSPTFNSTATATTPMGLWVLSTGSNILIEDCRFRFFKDNLLVMRPNNLETDLPLQNIRVRRNVITDSYSTQSHSQGMFARRVTDLLVEENVCDHNGWHGSVNGAEPTVFNHNIYLVECTRATVRANILTRGSLLGLKIASDQTLGFEGLEIHNNLIINNALGIAVSGNNQLEFTTKDLLIHKNVCDGLGRVINGTLNSVGLVVRSVDRAVIKDNYFMHRPFEKGNPAIIVEDLPHKNVEVHLNVVHDWPMLSNLPLIYNEDALNPDVQVESNMIELEPSQYFDASRTVASYNAALGNPPTLEAFIAEAVQQSSDRWITLYTAPAVVQYLKSGFTMIPDFD